jgi:hypothetical protein
MMLAPLKKSVNGLMVQWYNMQKQQYFVSAASYDVLSQSKKVTVRSVYED